MSEAILRRIREKVGEKVWKKWFSTFHVLEIGHERIVFGVSNLFIKDWLIKRYGKVISEVVKEILGENFEMEMEYVEPVEEKKISVRKRIPKKAHPDLNPNYTFENFVVGKGNEQAYKFACKIAQEPGRFSPLFIYGGVGLGKTHLMQAVGNAILRRNPNLSLIYASSERFMNEMVSAIRENNMDSFRKRYREVDVLLVDDVQFLMGKNGVQFELFNTFNELMSSGKQMVFCSDRAPDELQDFQERLVSRFKMGIVVRLDMPDLETRVKIAKVISEMEGGNLDEDLLTFLAENVDGTLRELRGAIIKLIAYQEIEGKKVSVYDAVGILDSFLKPVSEVDPLDRLMGVLSLVFDVSPSDIRGKTKKASATLAREMGIYFARKYMKASNESISRAFNRSSPVVSKIVRKLERDMRGNPVMEGYLQKILAYFSPAVGRM